MENNEQKTIKPKFYSDFDYVALKNLLGQNKGISPESIVHFSPVFYPIAIVEMDMEEKDFEDFDTINMTVLRVVSAGITDSELISETLGLNANYIENVKKILVGYGFVDGNMRITPLGKESLEQKKKITLHSSSQKFQIDALNRRILKVDKTTFEKNLKKPSKTTLAVPHIDYRGAEMEESEIRSVIRENPQEYLRERGKFLNVNVVSINSIRLDEVNYCKCYMMKIRGYDPIVFYTIEGKRKFPDWKPFAISSEMMRGLFPDVADLPVNSDGAKQKISEIYNMVKKEVSDITSEDVFSICDFDPYELRAFLDKGTDEFMLKINIKSFKKLSQAMVDMIASVSEDGKGIFICQNLGGRVITITTDDAEIISLAKRLRENGRKISKSKYIQKNKDCENPIEKIYDILSLIEDED